MLTDWLLCAKNDAMQNNAMQYCNTYNKGDQLRTQIHDVEKKSERLALIGVWE